MGCEVELLAKIQYVTDYDVNMYTLGEIVNIPFDEKELSKYIRTHGDKGINFLREHLSNMNYYLEKEVRAYREEISEKDECAKSAY